MKPRELLYAKRFSYNDNTGEEFICPVVLFWDEVYRIEEYPDEYKTEQKCQEDRTYIYYAASGISPEIVVVIGSVKEWVKSWENFLLKQSKNVFQ